MSAAEDVVARAQERVSIAARGPRHFARDSDWSVVVMTHPDLPELREIAQRYRFGSAT